MSNESHNKHTDKNDEKTDIDFHKIKKIFASKVFYGILLAVLIIIPVIFTICIRTQAMDMPATDSWAENSVYNYYENSIAQQVNSQYPNLPTAQKQKLIDEQFAQLEKTNKDLLTQQIQLTSEYFKTGFQYTENNHTYTFLGDLDSYFYLRYARNYEATGTVCDKIVNKVCVDSYMMAPIGGSASPSMHPIATVYLHKFLHFFNKNVNLMQAAFILPTIIAIIAAIAAFFIGRKLMNDVAGFFASMFVALSPLFLTRTLGSDTDVWNVMFPLVIILVFLYAFETKSLWKKLVLTSMTGLLMGLFSFAWGSGWWYIFDFIMAAIILYAVFELLKGYINFKRKHTSKIVTEELKQSGITFVTLLISTALFVTLFVSFSLFTETAKAPLSLMTGLKTATYGGLWPNVYTTVAELNEADISTIVSQTAFGINILFSLALLGIIFTLVKRKPTTKEYLLIAFSAIIYLFLISSNALNMNSYLYLFILMLPLIAGLLMLLLDKESVVDVKMALLLTIWFVGMIFASIKGVRFVLLLTPAFGIAIGVAIGYIFQYVSRAFTDGMKLNEKISKCIVFILLCLILIAPIQAGIAAGKTYMPSMTSGWWDSLTKIREESKPDAIINSWWDFGHWFKYVADRRVTLDGASQNHPNAHWLGLLLQTDDETRTVGILRMLDCGSNSAFDEIDKKFNDTEKSENIVSEIIVLDKADAQKYLKNIGYTNEEIERILNYTHCTPPEDYLITSEDMVGKAGVWSHFGLWNFDKAFIVNNVRGMNPPEGIQLIKNKWNYSDDEASKIYYEVQALQTDREMNDWISPWPGYATQSTIECSAISTNKNLIQCPLYLGIGSNSQQNIVIETTVINLSQPENSKIQIGVYDKTTNAKLGSDTATWSQILIGSNQLKTYNTTNVSIDLAILLDIETDGNSTTYRAVVANPLLIGSTFTKLFYLDGKYTEHFEKFSDTTDITGSRIIVWKVKW